MNSAAPPRLPKWPWWIVTAGGLGAAPKAPGTFGALGAIPICWGAMLLDEPWRSTVLAAALAVACGASVALGKWAEEWFGRKDPQAFVLDEVAGMLLTWLLFRPAASLGIALTAAFVATRVFDIAKPPPARRLEKLPRGWGVLLDDLSSSLWAVAVLHIGWWLWDRFR